MMDVEAAVRGEDVRAEKSETGLAKEHNNYAKCMQNRVGAWQNRQKNKNFLLFFIFLLLFISTW